MTCTPEVMQIFSAAEREAAERRHTQVDPHFLMLAILAEAPNIATTALVESGFDLVQVADAVNRRIEVISEDRVTDTLLRSSDSTQGALAIAEQEAQGFKQTEVSVEALFLGIIRTLRNYTGNVFQELKIETKPMRQKIIFVRAVLVD